MHWFSWAFSVAPRLVVAVALSQRRQHVVETAFGQRTPTRILVLRLRYCILQASAREPRLHRRTQVKWNADEVD